MVLIIPDEYKSIRTHRTTIFVRNDLVTYFNSFGNKNDSIMSGYFCIGFVDFMLICKSLLDYSKLISSKEYENTDEILMEYFEELKTKNSFYE